MTDHVLPEAQGIPDAAGITERHFGVNVVTIYDQEIADPGGDMQRLVGELGAKTLRFPGGSATELHFDMTDPDSAASPVPGAPALTPLGDFLAAAGQIDADVALVVPTRVGFAQSASEAMLDGAYGARSTLAQGYLDDVEQFVRHAITAAEAAGTRITTLEIGNEFWGSGQMTAAEYGFLAGHVAVRLQQVLDQLALGEVQIVVQATSAASKVFSPRDDAIVYIDADGEAHATPPEGPHAEVTVPGQGSARAQLASLTEALNAVPGAADAVDGAVLHLYQRNGFDGVDGGRDFTFDQLAAFAEGLDRSAGAPELSRHITEWNVAAGDHPDNAGLKQAAMLLETFFEMAEHGVTDAQIWPLSFNAAQGTALTDLDDNRLSIAGEIFRLMQESLPGLHPVLDWSVQGQIDLHGFASADRSVIFVSERSGWTQQDIDLDAGTMMPGESYFVAETALWDGGAGGSDAGAAPVIIETGGRVIAGDILELSLAPWANTRIELTLVDRFDNVVQGRGGDDRIEAYAGNDEIRGAGGHDHVDGGSGDDRIDGGAGRDRLIGGQGQDLLTGGADEDMFVFETGDGSDLITDFDSTRDRLQIDGAEAASMAQLAALDGVTLGSESGALVVTYGAGDQIRLEGHDALVARADGGRLDGTKADDVLLGGDARDDLRGGNGDDVLSDGGNGDVLRGGNGADLFVLARDGVHDRITDFTPDTDRIDLRAWGVSGFSDLSFEIEFRSDGTWKGRGYLRWQDEVIRLDGLDAAMLAQLDAQDFLF